MVNATESCFYFKSVHVDFEKIFIVVLDFLVTKTNVLLRILCPLLFNAKIDYLNGFLEK